MGKVTLDIRMLGGVQDFELYLKPTRNSRYVGSTWEGDGQENDGNYDIFHDRDSQEYYAVKS